MTYKDRPEALQGVTYKVKTGCGNLFVTINSDEHNSPFEVFAILSKSGVCAKATTEGLSRLTTLYLRSGGDINNIIKHLEGIACSSQIFDPTAQRTILSCGDGIAVALKRFVEKIKKSSASAESASNE